MRHPDIVRSAATSYLAHLNELLDSDVLQPAGRAAATALEASLRGALDHPGPLRRDDLPFTASLLAACSPEEKAVLVNQWALGLGNDGAPVLVMGTEQAFDVEDSPVGLALENCASPLLWLTDAQADVADWVAQDRCWVKAERGVYHRHPWRHFKVRPGQTWLTVADALGVPLWDLEKRAYLLDRSAWPAKTADAGTPPTGRRQTFLLDLMGAFGPTAQVLLLHGKTNVGGDWWACNAALSATFLGLATLPQTPEERKVGRAYIRRWQANGKTVLHTWALGGAALAFAGAPKAYVKQIGDLVAEALA